MVSKYSGSTGRKLGYDKRCNRGISWEDPIWPEMFRFRWWWGIGSFEWKRQQVTFTLSVMTSGQYIGQWEWHSDQYEDWNWLKYYTFSHTFDVWHAKRWSLLWFWSELCHFPLFLSILNISVSPQFSVVSWWLKWQRSGSWLREDNSLLCHHDPG